ncbi:MAG: PIN domain-containing protein [Persephonella sp.]|nr:PIN domain-containing protein [Persephonella sp.]
MSIKKIFVDANIIIDIFDKNRKNWSMANKIMNYCIDKDIQLYTSCDLITTVYYILSKKEKKKALENIKLASDLFELIPFANQDLDRAILSNGKTKDLKIWKIHYSMY